MKETHETRNPYPYNASHTQLPQNSVHKEHFYSQHLKSSYMAHFIYYH